MHCLHAEKEEFLTNLGVCVVLGGASGAQLVQFFEEVSQEGLGRVLLHSSDRSESLAKQGGAPVCDQ
jgi:hypothetical protein